MKKIMSLMLGLSLIVGAASVAFAGQDTKSSTKTSKGKGKGKSTKSSTKTS